MDQPHRPDQEHEPLGARNVHHGSRRRQADGSKHDGYSTSSTATQIRESPSRPGVIWIGTDDGNLQLSQDGGETFTNVYRQY